MTAVAAASSTVRSVNPATLDVVWQAPVASEDEIAEVIVILNGLRAASTRKAST